MDTVFKAYLPRVAGALIAMLAVGLSKRGIEMSPTLQAHATELVVGLALLAYAATHRVASTAVNPDDKAHVDPPLGAGD